MGSVRTLDIVNMATFSYFPYFFLATITFVHCGPVTSDKFDFKQLHSFLETRDSERSVYYISHKESSWNDAWFACTEAFNGDLLAIETPEENRFIRDLMIKEDISKVWTSGAYDDETEVWRWASTGESISYENFEGYPGNNTASRIVVRNTLFSNIWTTETIAGVGRYICEVSKPPSLVTTTVPTTTTTATTNVTTEDPSTPGFWTDTTNEERNKS